MMQFGALPHSFLSVGLKHREAKQQRVVTCEAAPRKGFGGGEDKKNKKNVKKQQQQPQQEGKVHNKRAVAVKEGSRQLQNILRNVDKETTAQQQKKLGIDPGMAAQGKVDFVRVEAWGQEGTEAELENLKLKSLSPAFSSKEEDNNVPFYEQLVRRLQLLESKGSWQLRKRNRSRRSSDGASEKNVICSFFRTSVQNAEGCRSCCEELKGPVASDNVEDVENRASLAVAASDSTLGLDGHEELAADIQALSEATTRIGMALEIRPPTTQTNAYVKVIEQIGRSAASGSAEGCRRLLAHIFAIHVAHLTTGMRVGAKAVECLSLLKEARAVHFYRDYPKQAQDPLRAMIAALNTAGSYLVRPEEREQVMQELPKAIQRTSFVLSVLAVEK